MDYEYKGKLARFVALLTFVAMLAATLWAQGGTGELTGLITDPTGAVISGVQVNLTNNSTGDKRTTISTPAGIYRFSALPIVGTYTLQVTASGFRPVTVQNIVATVGTTITRDIILEVGTTKEEVTVEAGSLVVQTVDSSVSQLVDRRVWESMPLETRSQNDFINLVAGAVPQTFDNTGRGAAVNGTRTGSGNYLVEGADNNEQGQGGVALWGAGGANTTISPDAIQEYRVITSDFPAEYGKSGGFVTDTVLKSGTNAWHGSAFEYNRIQALTANDFFSNRADQKDHLVRNQFGGSFGGPLIKDKMFFYGTGEIHRLRQGQPTSATGTTQDFLNFVNSGAFANFLETSPNGLCNNQTQLDALAKAQTIPSGVTAAPCPGAFSHATKLGPIFQNLLSSEATAFPLATGGGCGGSNCDAQGLYTAGIVYPVPVYGTITKQMLTQMDQSRFSVKFDYKPRENDQLNFVYLFDDVQYRDNNLGGSNSIGVPETNPNRAQNAAITWTHMLSPTILNQLRFGYVRRVSNYFAPGTETTPSEYTWLDPLGEGFGSYGGIPQFFTENQFQLKNDLSVVKGKHTFKGGAEYRRTRNGSSFFNDRQGTVAPWSVEDLVTDMRLSDDADMFFWDAPYNGSMAIASASINPSTGTLPDYYRGYRANEVGMYVQDDWRIHPRLTLNLGVRWEYFGPPHNFQPNTDSNFYFGAPTVPFRTNTNPFFPGGNPYYAMVATGSFQVRNHSIWNKDLNNFGPRVGFSWDTLGNQKLVLRGGFGIMYDRIYNNLFENIRFNPPLFADVTFGAMANGVPAGGLATPGFYQIPFVANTNGSLISPEIFPAGLPKANPRHMDQDLVSPYYQQAHFGLQYELARNFVLETNYIGTFGRKLTGIINLNTYDGRLACPVPSGGETYAAGSACSNAGFPTGFSSSRPNTTIGSDNFRTNAFNSNYNALQVSLRKNYSFGLQFNANYTYGKALDELSDAFRPKIGNYGATAYQPSDASNIGLDYGPADFDIRHRFVLSYNYDLPFMKDHRWLGGWQLNGIFSLQAGTPVAIWDPTNDLNGDGVTSDRPVYAPGFNGTNVISNRNAANGYFKPDSFASYSCPGDINMGLWCNSPLHRNDVYGPKFVNLDFGVGKSFKITEQTKLTFMANFFNLFNHPNMDMPEGNFGSPNFGYALNTLGDNGGHRITQLALRFDF